MDNDTKSYIQSLNTLGVNETKNIKMAQGNIILQVTDRRAMTDKYVAAVIKKPIEFSKNTYSDAYNKFSQFVSENQSLEAMQKMLQSMDLRFVSVLTFVIQSIISWV